MGVAKGERAHESVRSAETHELLLKGRHRHQQEILT